MKECTRLTLILYVSTTYFKVEIKLTVAKNAAIALDAIGMFVAV